MFTIAQQIAGGSAAAALLLSDHMSGTAWYQRTPVDEHGSTSDYAEALRDAAAADMFAVNAERASFDAVESIHQETRVNLLSDAELDAMTADIDVVTDDDDDVAFVVPFADGLGLEWPADEDGDETFMFGGVDYSDEIAPF